MIFIQFYLRYHFQWPWFTTEKCVHLKIFLCYLDLKLWYIMVSNMMKIMCSSFHLVDVSLMSWSIAPIHTQKNSLLLIVSGYWFAHELVQISLPKISFFLIFQLHTTDEGIQGHLTQQKQIKNAICQVLLRSLLMNIEYYSKVNKVKIFNSVLLFLCCTLIWRLRLKKNSTFYSYRMHVHL